MFIFLIREPGDPPLTEVPMTEPDKKTIGARIQKLRLSRGITQAQLAEEVGIDTVYVSQIERGHRLVSIGTLFRIAYVLNVRPGFLLDGDIPEDETPLAEEVRKLLEGWSEDQQKALVSALRALKKI